MTFPLPHTQLTPISGKPTAIAIHQLKKELYANARAIHSERGSANIVHLSIIIPTAAYDLRVGYAFNESNNPGVQLFHAATATSAQITAANRDYNHDLE